ncbi:MAG: hypothetical protein AAF389_03590 [Gemmatimonadota bacterium]
MNVRKKMGWLLAVGLAVFSLSLLAFQPVPASAYFGSCEAAGGPNGNCCACETGEFCAEVQHQGVQSCSSNTCGLTECEWLA